MMYQNRPGAENYTVSGELACKVEIFLLHVYYFTPTSSNIGFVLQCRVWPVGLEETSPCSIDQSFLNQESTSVLAGGIAHDFNNMLVGILGDINLSLLDPALSENTRKVLRVSEKASLRAQMLTQQLLTFAKGGEPVKEETSLVQIIKRLGRFYPARQYRILSIFNAG